MHEKFPGDRAALLTPVLDDETARGPIYSTGAEFFTAFLGGPLAILFLSGLNADLLGRLKADLWRYIFVGIASFSFVIWVTWLRQVEPQPPWLGDALGDEARRALRWAVRGFGLLVWVALWLPYRRYHKAAELMGIAPRKPWKAAIGCVAASFVLQMIITAAVAAQARGL